MDAQIYRMDDMRSRRSSATFTGEYFPMQSASDGLALIQAAMSFWVEYAVAMALFHQQAALAGCLPCSKLPKAWGEQ